MPSDTVPPSNWWQRWGSLAQQASTAIAILALAASLFVGLRTITAADRRAELDRIAAQQREEADRTAAQSRAEADRVAAQQRAEADRTAGEQLAGQQRASAFYRDYLKLASDHPNAARGEQFITHDDYNTALYLKFVRIFAISADAILQQFKNNAAWEGIIRSDVKLHCPELAKMFSYGSPERANFSPLLAQMVSDAC